MRFRLSRHAEDECKRRRIPVSVLESVLANPDQIVPAYGGRNAYQSVVTFGAKEFLVRAIVDDKSEPGTVVTVYRTSKIDKYWRPE